MVPTMMTAQMPAVFNAQTPPDPDFADLAAWVEHSDRAAIERVFRKYASDALRLACHRLGNQHDADDAVQNAFIGVMLGARRFRSGPGTVRGWIFTAVINSCAERRRQDRSRRTREALAAPLSSPSSDPDLVDAVFQALDELPDHQRQPVELRYLCGLEYPEIAALLRRKERTVRGQVNRGLDNLRGVCTRLGLAATPAVLAAILTTPEISPTAKSINACLTIAKTGPTCAAAASSLTAIGFLITAGAVALSAATWLTYARSPQADQEPTPADPPKRESKTVAIGNAGEDWGHNHIYGIDQSGSPFILTGRIYEFATLGVVENGAFRFHQSGVPWYGTYERCNAAAWLGGDLFTLIGHQRQDKIGHTVMLFAQSGSRSAGFLAKPQPISDADPQRNSRWTPHLFQDQEGHLVAAWQAAEVSQTQFLHELHWRRLIDGTWQEEQKLVFLDSERVTELVDISVGKHQWFAHYRGERFFPGRSVVPGDWIMTITESGKTAVFVEQAQKKSALTAAAAQAGPSSLRAVGDDAWLITSLRDDIKDRNASITEVTAMRIHDGEAEPAQSLWRDVGPHARPISTAQSGLGPDGKLWWYGLIDALGSARGRDPRGCVVIARSCGPDENTWSPVRRLSERVPLDAGASSCGFFLSEKGPILLGRSGNARLKTKGSPSLLVTSLPWGPLIEVDERFLTATVRTVNDSDQITVELPDPSQLTLFIHPSGYGAKVGTICSTVDPKHIATAIAGEKFNPSTKKIASTNGWLLGPNGELVAEFAWSERRGPVDPEAERLWRLEMEKPQKAPGPPSPIGPLLGLTLEFVTPAHFAIDLPDLEAMANARSWGPMPME
jgi:RNA polymerase sigma factor (sigma-70 family)